MNSVSGELDQEADRATEQASIWKYHYERYCPIRAHSVDRARSGNSWQSCAIIDRHGIWLSAVMSISAEHQESWAPNSHLAAMKRELMDLLERLTVSQDRTRRDELRSEALQIADRIRQHSSRNSREPLSE